MIPKLEVVLQKLEERNPSHTIAIRKSINDLTPEINSKIESFLEKYIVYLGKVEKSIDYGIDCYFHMIEDMQTQQLEFIRTGKYSSSSFDEVNKRVYNNPDIMKYHMHGLVLAQFLWYDQRERFTFFYKSLENHASNAKKYLEIGGGHGLYLNEALKLLPHVEEFDMIDISQSSLELAKGIISDNKIKYTLKNIFDFTNDVKFDFITVGEVIEHLEQPLALLKKIASLLTSDGVCYITTPINAPMIDHIYLFNSSEEIRTLFDLAGFQILEEKTAISFNKSISYAEKFKTPVMFAAFIKRK